MVDKSDFSSVKTRVVWGKIISWFNCILEYTGDYLSGCKHKYSNNLEHNKQK